MAGGQAWVVHKFGGSSVADATCFKRVAEIIGARRGERLGVVLSACKGVTDQLYEAVRRAETRESAADVLQGLTARHTEIAEALLTKASAAAYLDEFANDIRNVEGILRTVELTRAAAGNVRDLIVGFGEIWSTRLFARFIAETGVKDVRWVDAREAVVVEWGPLGPSVDWALSQQAVNRLGLREAPGPLIITGFVASDKNGVQTTLGRNGSDFSASIFGKLLGAKEIDIWTDVDGVLSADPRRVPAPETIDALSYNEAMELAYFGAKVIHPQTMSPAVESKIPIRILNTFNPDAAGTLICAEPKSSHPVKGITSIENVALIDLEGAGMIGVPGTAHRLFGALREAGVSVILISQGSSEHSICCAVPGDQVDRAAKATREAFEREIATGQIQSVEVDRELSILAVVGDGMAGTPGVAANLFGALARASVNVRAIAQGASERNISVVVDAASTSKALRAVHAAFYLSPHALSVAVIGPGAVGSALLDQLASQTARLRSQFNIDFRFKAIASSKRALFSDSTLKLEDWRGQLERDSQVSDLARVIEHVSSAQTPHRVLIDCSASEDVARIYADLFARGVHVITANKKAGSADIAYFQQMQDKRRASGAHFLYEATVGAGLPILQTLHDLRETGDEVAGVEGILSGTLAFLFNSYNGEVPFSEVVKDARQRGYTEPDPRDDLSGLDVARKLIILAREMGLKLELKDVKIESLIPAALKEVSVDEFMARLSEFDGEMKQRYAAAKANGRVLRHVGRVNAKGEASVGVIEVEPTAALANSALTDNVVRFQTRRYHSNPLLVQGPGAGPEVTAGGVFADLLRLSAYLGARM
ncbi:MAG: bifunctional aspartate kinase/homoserine dehydrogenase I [Hyphomonadaceae bacterium]|nr:bifunctional aspartate kinase/homoserine dehydrogenase I [Hyphomonadaceae bacterium]